MAAVSKNPRRERPVKIAYDHLNTRDPIAGTTDAQSRDMAYYSNLTKLGNPTRWSWRYLRAHRHCPVWREIENAEDFLDLIQRAKRRWKGKGSFLVQWYGTRDLKPIAVALFHIPKRTPYAVNDLTPTGFPSHV
jgi:hypothetical protein